MPVQMQNLNIWELYNRQPEKRNEELTLEEIEKYNKIKTRKIKGIIVPAQKVCGSEAVSPPPAGKSTRFMSRYELFNR